MMLITVKYHGPTNYRGSRWSATMQSPSGAGNDTIRVYQAYLYGEQSGATLSAKRVIDKWESMCGLSRENHPGSWSVEAVGNTHDYLIIFKPTWTYDNDVAG